MNKPIAKYLKICPIDKNEASIEEILEYKLCLKDYNNLGKTFDDLIRQKECSKLHLSKNICEVEKQVENFIDFFKSTTGYVPFSLQNYWIKRFLNGESFSIIAPTGFGKSTFGIVLSLFLANKNKKIYYLVPTKILLKEIENKFLYYKKDLDINIITIKESKDKINLDKNNFNILITTSQFLHKNFDSINKYNFDLLYIDDADSMIRQPRNIDKVLNLIGFNQQEIDLALSIIDKKRKKEYKEALEIKNSLNLSNKGQVIAASATLTPRTKRINLFRELLNFEISSSSTFLRNIIDIANYVGKDKNILFNKSLIWIKRLGNGGLIFLSEEFTKEDILDYISFLEKNNIRAISYEKFNQKNINLFKEGEIKVIVGFSNIRNPLTRGIDLPHIIRYSIFIGVPRFKINLEPTYSPKQLLLLYLTLKEYLSENLDFFNDLKFLRKYSFLNEDQIINNQNLKSKIEKIRENINNLIKEEDFLKKIENDTDLNIIKKDGRLFLIVSDPRGYIQASGRTSRLYPLGLTQGLSILLIDDKKSFDNLKYKLKVLGYDLKFENYEINDLKIEKIIKKIDKDRKIVKNILEGREYKLKNPVKTCLIIVESPTKAKTISSFFGKPTKRNFNGFWVYEISIGNYLINIIATLGHFVDLINEKYYYGVIKDNENKFIPVFEPLKICQNCLRHIPIDQEICEICKKQNFLNKELLIDLLKKLANENEEIYLATDPDTEGEKIAFDLFAYLYPFNQKIYRIELHEITKEEFIKQFYNPRKINLSLVCAQLTRRIADRWVGFYLSQDLQNKMKNLNLSAGRVQTPVLKWLIDREEQRKKEKYYLIRINLDNEKYIEFTIDDENKKIINYLRNKKNEFFVEFKIIKEYEEEIKPPPPFETSDLLKTSWQILKLDTNSTMNLAQDLFERGFITYHRTDSYYVSNYGRNLAKEFFKKLNKENLFLTRSWGEPGTHEAIRPTKTLTYEEILEKEILNQEELLSKKHLNLYNLILNRFLASQAKSSKVKKVLIKINLISKEGNFFSTEKEIVSDIIYYGFQEFFKIYYPFKIEKKLFNIKKIEIKRFPKNSPFTVGSLVEEMKNKNLGRPSTYANIIQTILDRKYAIVNKGFIIPTKLGKEVYSYLQKKYYDLINEDFTKTLESNMDLIEKNEIEYQEILQKLFLKISKI
jgi:reverse gyrase